MSGTSKSSFSLFAVIVCHAPFREISGGDSAPRAAFVIRFHAPKTRCTNPKGPRPRARLVVA